MMTVPLLALLRPLIDLLAAVHPSVFSSRLMSHRIMVRHFLIFVAVLAVWSDLAKAATTTTTTKATTTTTTSAPCSTTAWSEWASCNGLDCLAGTESRVRTFINPLDNGVPECGNNLGQVRCVTGDCMGLMLVFELVVISIFGRPGVHDG